jgi:hypothetical protein
MSERLWLRLLHQQHELECDTEPHIDTNADFDTYPLLKWHRHTEYDIPISTYTHDLAFYDFFPDRLLNRSAD